MHVRNLLGAAALAISDLMVAGATTPAGLSTSAAAALVVLSTEPGLSVTGLGQRIGLSQPAAARMVDALVARGLVRRRPTTTRSVAVRLTATGATAARQVLRSRDEVLARLAGTLTAAEQDTLVTLLHKILTNAYAELPSSDRLCRLCDRACCVAGDRICPVGQAERDTAVRGHG